jgi:Mlc titration factor MtfA (ptsG expression regulator)
LNPEEKKNFEVRVYKFLLNCRIVGVKTKIDITDKLLIGASAIIPIFKFPDWEYRNLDEILVFPDTFNRKFEVTGPDRNILGVVGEGILDKKMLISKKAIHNGFDNDTDKKNTAIHEFIHLIDKLDGNIDGIPRVLIQYPNTIPWIDIISQKILVEYFYKSNI